MVPSTLSSMCFGWRSLETNRNLVFWVFKYKPERFTHAATESMSLWKLATSKVQSLPIGHVSGFVSFCNFYLSLATHSVAAQPLSCHPAQLKLLRCVLSMECLCMCSIRLEILVPFPGCTLWYLNRFPGCTLWYLGRFPGCTLCWYLGFLVVHFVGIFLVVHFVGILVPFPGCELGWLWTWL